MTVEELIEALQRCSNQKAQVVFWDNFDYLRIDLYSVIEESEDQILLNG